MRADKTRTWASRSPATPMIFQANSMCHPMCHCATQQGVKKGPNIKGEALEQTLQRQLFEQESYILLVYTKRVDSVLRAF